MSDPIDQQDEREAIFHAAKIEAIRRNAVIDPGVSGECDLCGEFRARLIKGFCACCRDKRKLA